MKIGRQRDSARNLTFLKLWTLKSVRPPPPPPPLMPMESSRPKVARVVPTIVQNWPRSRRSHVELYPRLQMTSPGHPDLRKMS